MGNKVLVYTQALVPLPGLPVSGEGLRAWSLGEGLRAHGFDVAYALPAPLLETLEESDSGAVAYDPADPGALIESQGADVLLFAQWPLLATCGTGGLPVVLDTYTPLLLRQSLAGGTRALDPAMKAMAFGKADLLLCTGERQQAYAQAWQLSAGLCPDDPPAVIVPPALAPEMPAWEPPGAPTVVYAAGTAWADPLPGLRLVADLLADRGVLRVLAGGDEGLPPALRGELGEGAHIEVWADADFDAWCAACRTASAAYDLHRDHAGRAMACPMETIACLWNGLPVIHSRFSPLARHIHQYGAGWTGDPDNVEGLRRVFERALGNPMSFEEAGRNAQRLVADHFTWNKAVAPLAAFCASPSRRDRAATAPGAELRGAPGDTGEQAALDERIAELELVRTELEQMAGESARDLAAEQARAQALESEVQRLSADVSRARDMQEELQIEVRELKARLAEEPEAANTAREETEARLAEQLRQAAGDRAEAERVLRARIDGLTRQLAEAQEARAALQEALDAVDARTAEAEAEDRADMEGALSRLQEELLQVAEAQARERESWESARAALLNDLESARAALDELREDHERERAAWRETKQALAAKLKQLLAESAAHGPGARPVENGLSELRDEIERKLSEMEDMKRLGSTIQRELGQTREELTRLKEVFHGLEGRWRTRGAAGPEQEYPAE